MKRPSVFKVETTGEYLVADASVPPVALASGPPLRCGCGRFWDVTSVGFSCLIPRLPSWPHCAFSFPKLTFSVSLPRFSFFLTPVLLTCHPLHTQISRDIPHEQAPLLPRSLPLRLHPGTSSPRHTLPLAEITAMGLCEYAFIGMFM